MKTIMYLFSFIMLTSMTFKNNVSPTDPIPGVDVKLGCKGACTHTPKHKPNTIIANTVTDENGQFRIADLPYGVYWIKIGYKETGIKGFEKPIIMEGIQLAFAASGSINTTSNRKPTVIVKQEGDVEITLTVTENSIRGTVLNTSRSNIKQRN